MILINGGYSIRFGNLFGEDDVKWSDTEIHLDSKSMMEFLKRYAEEFTITQNDTNTPFIETLDGVNLSVATFNLQKQLEQEGIDINELLAPKTDREDLITLDEQQDEKLQLKENTDDFTIQNTSPKEEQENQKHTKSNFIQKIIQKISSNKILRRIPFINKLTNKQKLLPKSSEQEARRKDRKELPPWDLRNWTDEELAICAAEAKKLREQRIAQEKIKEETDKVKDQQKER